MSTQLELVRGYWSQTDCSASERNFYCFPALRVRACQLIFGEQDASRPDWCEHWTIQRFFHDRIPFGDCLSLCSGFGHVERTLASLGLAERYLGVDVADGAIAEARQRASAAGLQNISYEVADLNSCELPTEAFDVIWANGALHHMADPDALAPRLYRALRPGGYLVANEYVGPDYQQVGLRQTELINATRLLLPPELREPDAWLPRPVRWFLDNDPSECVRSSRVVPSLRAAFPEVDVRPFHGSLLFYTLGERFYNGFEFDNPQHRAALEMLFEVEDRLIQSGEIGSDNAHIICHKPDDRVCLARERYARGELEPAREVLEAVVREGCDDRDVLNDLAVVRHRLGDGAGAAELFLRCTDLAPEAVDPVVNAAHVLTQLGRAHQAIAVLEEFLARHPGEPEVVETRRQIRLRPLS